MRSLRQLIVGGALASAVVTVGCAEPTSTPDSERPPTKAVVPAKSEAAPYHEGALQLKFRNAAARAAAAGDSQAVHALRLMDSTRTAVARAPLSVTRGNPSDGMRRLDVVSDAEANIPGAGWQARIITGYTSPTIAPGTSEFMITSFVSFFGTTGENKPKYTISGTASGSAELPAQSGNTGAIWRCLANITSLASCLWNDTFTSTDRVMVPTTCGASMRANGIHRAWFAIPLITVGVSGGGPSLSTSGAVRETGSSATLTDLERTATNGRCITITMAETTAPSTRLVATISGSCSNASWSSSDPTVAYLTPGSAGTANIDARSRGTATISVSCSDGGNGSKTLSVESPDGDSDGAGGGGGGDNPGDCKWYLHYRISDDGTVVYQLPDECLYFGFGSSAALTRPVREGMLAIDLAHHAIQPAGPPPTTPSGTPICTADKPDICWTLLYSNPDFVDPANPWAAPGRFVVAGGYSAYPLTVTYRYNGRIVYQGTAVDPNHIPDPPMVKLTGVVDGDEIVYSATVTDRNGVTLTTATSGWVVSAEENAEGLRRRELNRSLRAAIRAGDKSALPRLMDVRKEIAQDMITRHAVTRGKN